MGPIKRIKPEVEVETGSNNLPSVSIQQLANFFSKTVIGVNNESSGVKPKTSMSANFTLETTGTIHGGISLPTQNFSASDSIYAPGVSQLTFDDQVGSERQEEEEDQEVAHFLPSDQDANGNIQQLRAVILDTKFPHSQCSQRVCYDGADSIYILGGWTEEDMSRTIYRFSILTHAIEEVGSLPKASADGPICSENDGKITTIFYFGGSNGRDVYKFNTETKICSMIAELPYSVTHGKCLKGLKGDSDSNTVYILGGNTTKKHCLAFDLVSLTSRIMKEPSFCPFPSTAVPFASSNTNKAFFYGGVWKWGRETLHEFNLRNLRMTPVGHEDYPQITEIGESVGDGRFMYLIGGYSMFQSTSTFRTDGITQFDPVTMKSRFISVTNFPVGGVSSGETLFLDDSHYHRAPSCVYVKRLNRIYFFGGRICDRGTLKLVDDIFYIDLSTQ